MGTETSRPRLSLFDFHIRLEKTVLNMRGSRKVRQAGPGAHKPIPSKQSMPLLVH